MNAFPCKAWSVVMIAALLACCGGPGSSPPAAKPGTPEFDWLAAKAAFKNGNYAKAQGLLVDVAKKETPFASQARPWAIVLSLAMANGYWELSEQYAEGLKKPHVNAAPLRRMAGNYRGRTTAVGMQFAEISRTFIDTNKDKDVTLVFDLAQASTNEPQQYAKIAEGVVVPDAEQAGVERSVIQRHMLLIVADAMNMKKDPAKVKELWQGGELKVPGQGFLLAEARGMYWLADVFGPKKLLQPNRILVALYDEAKEALEMVKDNKEAKDLLQKVTAMQKKMKE
jgi:hypothetical protein